MTDFRAELQSLIDACESFADPVTGHAIVWQTALNRARAALAQPEPETPAPTQRELLQLAAQFWPEGCEPLQAVPFARAVLDRRGRPTPQPIPVSERLRADLRPHPPSLKELALQMLGTIERDARYLPEITNSIRRAVESLDD